jgi:hypothetical protein
MSWYQPTDAATAAELAATAPKFIEVLQPGEYDFEITSAVLGNADDGQKMITIDARIIGPDSDGKARDWLLPNDPKMKFKLRYMCEAVGLIKVFEAGQLQVSDFLGRKGRAHFTRRNAKKLKEDGTPYQNNHFGDLVRLGVPQIEPGVPVTTTPAPTKNSFDFED